MKKILLLTTLGVFSLLLSCGDKEDKVTDEDLIRKSWILDSYIVENVPDAYSIHEGSELNPLYGEDKYTLTFDGNTYTRELTAGGTVYSEEGEWTLNEGELVLDPNGQGLGLQTLYTITLLSESDLNMKITGLYRLESNTFRDTVSQEFVDYYNSLLKNGDTTTFLSLYNTIFQSVTVDVVHDFDLSTN